MLMQKLYCKDELNNIIEIIKNKGVELKNLLDKTGGYKTLKIETIEGLEKQKEIPPMPDFKQIDDQIIQMEEKMENYRKAKMYKSEYEQSVEDYEEICKEIEELEKRIKEKLQAVKLPEQIKITSSGVFYKDMPVDEKHLSKSELYIVSLMLSSVNLKELRTLYFDCSPLDKNNLKDVLVWAKQNDLQLLIERPDFEGGELKFEIIEDN